ncbi:hypothetical protein CEB3_c27120 [Peptococcaceae bacterium CEB3]|nr:hypothetical protein CEB3_c27120 [Peptococcaceae bacterium CEB3]
MMNYSAALESALAQFRAASLEQIGKYSGYTLADDRIEVDFLGHKSEVEHPSGRFYPEPAPEGDLPIFARILILHYLSRSSPVQEQGRLISYKEIPGGSIYIQPFTNRAIRPVVQAFGDKPQALLEAGLRLGGRAAAYGDAAVTIPVFPRIPVTLVIWGGDDEFPANANILFDASAAHILPAEDYAVMAGFVAATLQKMPQGG